MENGSDLQAQGTGENPLRRDDNSRAPMPHFVGSLDLYHPWVMQGVSGHQDAILEADLRSSFGPPAVLSWYKVSLCKKTAFQINHDEVQIIRNPRSNKNFFC